MATWKAGFHHWIDNEGTSMAGRRKDSGMLTDFYGRYTTYMSGPNHVQAQRNARKYGPIGAVARYTHAGIIQGDGFIMYSEQPDTGF